MIKSTQGYTLIECMVVVIILGILAAIAIPSYESYLQRSRRSDATSSLMRVSLEQARYQADNMTYASSLVALGYAGASVDSDHGYYTIAVKGATATTFTATATPKVGTTQESDSCGTFSITQAWPNNLSAAEKACWEQG